MLYTVILLRCFVFFFSLFFGLGTSGEGRVLFDDPNDITFFVGISAEYGTMDHGCLGFSISDFSRTLP